MRGSSEQISVLYSNEYRLLKELDSTISSLDVKYLTYGTSALNRNLLHDYCMVFIVKCLTCIFNVLFVSSYALFFIYGLKPFKEISCIFVGTD